MSARVYALANQKGGVGKTTTAINMAACVAEAGTPVLLIDLDPQANATTGLGFRPEQLNASTYDLLHGRPLEEVVVETAVPNLFLVPSHPDLAAAQVELPSRSQHSTLLRDLLAGTEERFPVCLRRLPAVAGPPDRERACGCKPADRAGAVRVLRPRGARAAPAERRACPDADQPAPRHHRSAPDDVRRPHPARERRRQRGAHALRPARLRHGGPAQHPPGRGTQPRPADHGVRRVTPPAPMPTTARRWRWSSVADSARSRGLGRGLAALVAEFPTDHVAHGRARGVAGAAQSAPAAPGLRRRRNRAACRVGAGRRSRPADHRPRRRQRIRDRRRRAALARGPPGRSADDPVARAERGRARAPDPGAGRERRPRGSERGRPGPGLRRARRRARSQPDRDRPPGGQEPARGGQHDAAARAARRRARPDLGRDALGGPRPGAAAGLGPG